MECNDVADTDESEDNDEKTSPQASLDADKEVVNQTTTTEGSAWLGRQEVCRRVGSNMRLLYSPSGQPVGRASITPTFPRRCERGAMVTGVITVGGLRAAPLSGICGVLAGKTTRAARDAAMPIVTGGELGRWAEEQADLISSVWTAPEDQSQCAQIIRLCGGKTGRLPIAVNREGWINAQEIATRVASLDAIILIDHLEMVHLSKLKALRFDDNVFLTEVWSLPVVMSRSAWGMPGDHGPFSGGDSPMPELGGAVVEAAATGWGIDAACILLARRLRERDVRVGVAGETIVRSDGVLIRRPSSAAHKGVAPDDRSPSAPARG